MCCSGTDLSYIVSLAGLRHILPMYLKGAETFK